jgi:hypothetical protein
MEENKNEEDDKFIKMFDNFQKLMRIHKCTPATYATLCLTNALEILIANSMDREECHKVIKTAIDDVYDNKERIK